MQEIPGIPGYVISEDSTIVFVKFNRTVKSHSNGYGYRSVVLMGGNKKSRKAQTHLVHRLVALTFIPNPLGKPHVHHIDHNKSNNHVSNLMWVTQKENFELNPLDIKLKCRIPKGYKIRKDLIDRVMGLVGEGKLPREISKELGVEIRKIRSMIRRRKKIKIT